MKAFLQTAIVAGIIGLVCGCSQKPAAPTPQLSVITTPAGTFNLADVDMALKEKNYDGAVQVLAQVKAQYANLDEAQRTAFDQKASETANALLEVKLTDPTAGAAYTRLGKIVTGR